MRHYLLIKQIIGLVIFSSVLVLQSCTSPPPPKEQIVNIPVKINSDIGLLHHMQGRWIDYKNDEAILEINGIQLISEYQGDVMNIQEIIVAKDFPENCKGTPNEGGLGFFITKTDEGPYCYQILELSEQRIRYEAVGLID